MPPYLRKMKAYVRPAGFIGWLVLALPAAPALGETRPGGDAAATIETPDAAFAGPVGTLPDAERARFAKGSTLFYTRWVTGNAPPPALVGAGPLYNALSCEQCHKNDGRGRPPEPGAFEPRVTGTVAQFPFPLSGYGAQLQDRAIGGQTPEGRLYLEYVGVGGRYPDGAEWALQAPVWALEAGGSGPVPAQVSIRTAPAVFGLGLLEAIPDARLDALADPEDADGDGVSGRRGPGRFGWRADRPSLRDQTAHAFAIDMGVSTTLYPQPYGDCTGRQKACRAAAGAGVEADDALVQAVVDYVANLGPPPRRGDLAAVAAGEALFQAVGCAACHVPSHRTGAHRLPWLSGHVIRPFTDLLLHDMGDGLADGGGSEWRTPPLWGLGRHGEVNGHARLLHDGRAATIEEAILWHGGEAAGAKAAFMALPKTERDQLLAFLASL